MSLRRLSRGLAVFFSILAILALASWSPAKVEKSSDKTKKDQPDKATTEKEPKKPDIKWQKGPIKANMEAIAEVQVPEGFLFADKNDTKKLMGLMGNPTTGKEVGFVSPESVEWFVVFEYSEVGYVKDDDKDKLDADALLESIKEGTEEGNKERKTMGVPPLTLIGWEQKPKYDPITNNLEWAVRLESEGKPVINYNTRLLGRGGVMEVSLVVEPDKLAATLPNFKELLKNYSYKSGQHYSEYHVGDKVAAYGLVALITGGTVAVAAKTGLLSKFFGLIALGLAKLGKLILVVVAAVGGFLKKLYAKIFGKRKADATELKTPEI